MLAGVPIVNGGSHLPQRMSPTSEVNKEYRTPLISYNGERNEKVVRLRLVGDFPNR